DQPVRPDRGLPRRLRGRGPGETSEVDEPTGGCMTLDDAPLAAVLEDTATIYETVASLPTVVERIDSARSSGKPSSQPPPGAGDILDADEHWRAVTACDEWALFL